MKAILLMLALPLMGCGTIQNLFAGPQIYGGVRQDLHTMEHVCKGQVAAFDIPLSFVMDTALVPLTALFELFRLVTGWPPRGVPQTTPDPPPSYRLLLREWRDDLENAERHAGALRDLLTDAGFANVRLCVTSKYVHLHYGSYATRDAARDELTKILQLRGHDGGPVFSRAIVQEE